MNDLILEFGAALLSLYFLLYSLTVRRHLYEPRPKGLVSTLQNQHWAFLAGLGTVRIASLTSVAAGLGQHLHCSAGLFVVLHILRHLFRSLLYPLLLCYTLDLCGRQEALKSKKGLLFCLPLLLGTLVLLSNPLNHLCFTIDDALGIYHGPLGWLPYGVSVLYIALALAYFFPARRSLPVMDQVATLFLVLVVTSGTLVQAICSVSVELFFQAVALFGRNGNAGAR